MYELKILKLKLKNHMMPTRYEKRKFGPVYSRQIRDDLESTELAKEKVKFEEDKRAIKTGYEGMNIILDII